MAFELHVHDTGVGTPLLLLHAFPQDASMWDHQVAAWSDRFRCLRPDAWGCGRSGPPPPHASLDRLADAVAAALDDRGIGVITVVGASMGGFLALAMLRRHPQRLGALVLVGSRIAADGEAARQARLAMAGLVRSEGVEPVVAPMLERLLAPRARAEPHITDPVAGRIRRCTPAGVATCQEMMAARPDSTDLLESVRFPSLVVRGQEDLLLSGAESAAIAAAIPGAELLVMQGCGHLPNLEAPRLFNAAVGAFLDRVAGAAPIASAPGT